MTQYQIEQMAGITTKEIANSVTDDVYDVVINQTKLEMLEEVAKLIK